MLSGDQKSVLCIVIAAIAGAVAGMLLSIVGHRRLKKRIRNLEQQNRQLSRDLAKAKAEVKQNQQAREDAEQWYRLVQLEQKEMGKSPSASNPGPKRKQSVQTTERIDYRKNFRPESSLQLLFQYQLPESLILQPGEGYLRDKWNRLIPDASQFERLNTANGYAMDGLFYLFDVRYRGRRYSFRQILDGEMGGGYVQIQLVDRPAEVNQVGGTDHYGLSAKGLLTVTDA